MNDDGFVTRTLRMSVGAAVFGAWFLLALGRLSEAASFGIGAAIALAMMWTARYAVVKATTPGRLHGKWFAITLAVAKYSVAAYVIWCFLHWPRASVISFVAGVAITQVVLTMKAVGQIMHSVQSQGKPERPGGTKRWLGMNSKRMEGAKPSPGNDAN